MVAHDGSVVIEEVGSWDQGESAVLSCETLSMRQLCLLVMVSTLLLFSGCDDGGAATGEVRLSPAARKADASGQEAMRGFMRSKVQSKSANATEY